ncbi:MAG: hypothetical protein E7358_02045 [Clostridiales bacterium]|nr:hypothetical protein [Clostridiales bacterium]
MILKKVNTPIVCDMGGCKNTAKYFIKKQVDESNFDSLKLCEKCAEEIYEVLKEETVKKGKKSEGKK